MANSHDETSSVAADIFHIFVSELSYTLGLDSIGHGFAVALPWRGIRRNQPCRFKSNEMSIQTRPAYLAHRLDVPHCRRSMERKLAQNIRLGSIADETYSHLNLRGEFGSDETGHDYILPDPERKTRFEHAIVYY